MALDIKISFSWVNYCRLCLQDKGLKIPIFERDGVAENIPVKIKACLNISTYDGDPLPRMICHQCLCKLNTAYELHTKAMESFRLVLISLKPLKHVPSVEEYMKDCQSFLEKDESKPSSPAETHISRPATGKKSGTASGSVDEVKPTDEEEPQDQVRGRVTRSRVSGKTAVPVDSSTAVQKGSSITIVPSIENPSLTSSAASPKDPVFLVPLPPKPKRQDNHFQDSMDYESSEDLSKRKRKRITDHYDEALMDTGGNLVLAAGVRTRESRHRDGKRKKVGPASRTRALATCLPFPSSWQCVLCSCFFASHSMLRRHLSICLICQTCGLEFSSAKDKAVHEEDHMYVNLSRTVDLLYKCNNCDRAFAAHLMLKMHMKYDHPESSAHLYADPNQPSPYVDPASPEEDADAGDGDSCKCESDEDNKSAKDERTIEGHEICPKCTRPFVTKQRLNYHLLDHDQLIKCLFCPWKFPVGPGRRRHQRRMHGDKAEPVCFTCSLCKETFETKSILFLHKKNSHEKIEPPEEASKAEGPSKKTELEHCHVCDKMIQPSKFMAHLLHHANDAYDKTQPEGTVHNADTLQCPICNVTSATPEQHRSHIAQKHIQQKSNTFRCDGCSQTFANVEAINRHSCPGKEKGKQWKNCKHCGQNLSDDIVHVCDNECPICHKIFKSSRGQRLHIQHKHENQDLSTASVDDQANSETRSSGGDSGTTEPGGFESVSVKEEKEDAEETTQGRAELETTEQSTELEESQADSAADETMDKDELATPEESPTTTSNPVSDEPSSSTSPVPPTSTPIKLDPAVTAAFAQVTSPAKGTPKIRLRPSGTLISDAPSSANAPTPTPKYPGYVITTPPPYRPPQEAPPLIPFASAPNPVRAETNITKSILIRKNNGPGESYSMVVSNIGNKPPNSVKNTLMPASRPSVPQPRVDHSYTSTITPACTQATLANLPTLTLSVNAPTSSLAMGSGGISLGLCNSVPPGAMSSTFTATMAPSAFIPLSNSSQIPSNNLISTPNVNFSEAITLNRPAPPIILNPKGVMGVTGPSVLPQPSMVRTVPAPMNPLNQNNSIRCVQISALQTTPVSSIGSQILSNQSNIDHGYGKMYNSVQAPPPPTVFDPLQPVPGADGREENLLRDVLLGRRVDQDFL